MESGGVQKQMLIIKSLVLPDVFEWSDVSTSRLLSLFCSHYANPTKCVDLVQSGHYSYLFECDLFSPSYNLIVNTLVGGPQIVRP
jgi:hypothetical protein